MSVHREKDPTTRQERKRRMDSSSSRKPIRDESRDKRPVITQEKPTKQASTSSNNKSNPLGDKVSSSDKVRRRRTEGIGTDRNKEEKHRRSLQPQVGSSSKIKNQKETKMKKETKTEIIYMKDILEKKAERGSSRGVAEKLKRESYAEEVTKRKEIDEIKLKSRRDRTRTRTLSPTEVKQLVPSRMAFELASGDQNRELYSREQRTVHDGNEKKEKEEEETKAVEEDEQYEDDFEDYESDFEEDESEASETSNRPSVKLISVLKPEADKEEQTPKKQPDVDEEWKLKKQKKEIDEIKKVIERENLEINERRTSIAEAAENKENMENSTGSWKESSHSSSRKQRKKEAMKESLFCISSMSDGKNKTKTRGEQLLSMISLDAISYSILEIPPIPYEEFMKIYGKSNTKQALVQTNEDDLDEETQTDEIKTSNKWTQNPPEYLGTRKTENRSYILTKEERLGVGGDTPPKEDYSVMESRANGLSTFLSRASQAVLVAMEKKSGNFLSLENMPNHSKAMAIGDGFVYLNVKDIPFLSGRSITHLCLHSRNTGKLLSVHVNMKKSFQKSMICVWSFLELSKPLKILVASNRVTSLRLGPHQGSLVFAGLADGSLCLWDLREPSIYHNRATNNPEWTLQSPTYTTAAHMGDNDHTSSVVSVRLLSKPEDESSIFENFTPMQICSLDDNGTIVIWSVIQIKKTQNRAPSEDLGLTHWGRVKLVKSSSFSVFSNLRDEIPGLYITCNDLLVNEAEEDGLYVANSLGSVHHCSTHGSFLKPKFYVPAKQDAIIEATCLELCPFNGNYFLVGCGDGSIRLHSIHQEFPLICLNSVAIGEREAAVLSLNWMPMRPCIFFALDAMSRIHIWNLGVSDMYPEISLLLTKKEITCMKLMPISDPRQIPFIVVGAEDGKIEIHRLKKEYGARSAADVQNEKKMFLKYVSIL